MKQNGNKEFLNQIGASNYKKKVKRVSTMIDKWHARITIDNSGTFDQDEEWVNDTINSPSKFESNSSDEEGQATAEETFESECGKHNNQLIKLQNCKDLANKKSFFLQEIEEYTSLKSPKVTNKYNN